MTSSQCGFQDANMMHVQFTSSFHQGIYDTASDTWSGGVQICFYITLGSSIYGTAQVLRNRMTNEHLPAL